jgi:hypothetical protein
MEYFDDFEKNLPKRTDDWYKRIENFKPYELTHCIVFEMAGRNKDIKQHFQILVNLEEVLKIEYRTKPDNNNEHIYPYELLGKKDVIKVSDEKYKELEEQRRKYKEIYREGINILKNKYYIHYDQVSANIPEIENPFKEVDFSGMSLEEALKEAEERFSDALHSPMMKHISGIAGKFVHGEEYPHYKSDHNIYEGFVTARGIDPRCNTFNISSINTYFQRKIYDTNQINVALNMSLPENEIVEYIKHIKKTLSNENTKELKSPNKLLGRDVQEVKKTKHYPKKQTAKKLADMFFVYDYVTARIDDYTTNNQDSIKNEIFDELESYIPISYYLEKQNKDYLDSENDQDMIFKDLVSPLYREKIKRLQRSFNKKNIHTKIDEICNIFKNSLDASEISIITKKYSKKIENPKENNIFDDLETILYSKHKKNIENHFSHIEKKQRDQLLTDIETHINQYKISSSTASNYYYALKPYIEECRYPEFLTGESIIISKDE